MPSELRPRLAFESHARLCESTRLVGPGTGEFRVFQPGAGIAMGYDDLKVIEAERFVRSIAEGKPYGATIDDAVAAADAVAAMQVSTREWRWVEL